MAKKKNFRKKSLNSKYFIIFILLIIISITIINMFHFSHAQKEYTKKTEYYTGEIIKPNYSANLLDSLETNENIVISPSNITTSLAILYNASENNTYNELKNFFKKDLSMVNSKMSIIDNSIKNEWPENEVTTYYEKITNPLLEYANNTNTKIEDLSEKNRQKLILNIIQSEKTYLLIKSNNYNNNELKRIKKYKLNKNEEKLSLPQISNKLLEILNYYNKYKLNKIDSKNIIINKDNKLTNNESFQKNIEKYNNFKTIIYKGNNKEFNNELKDLSNYNWYLDDNTIKNNELLFINSFSFEDGWQEEFNNLNNIDEDFFVSQEEKIIVEMMRYKSDTYLENNEAYGFMKDFSNSKYTFVGILPKDEKLSKLSNINIENLLTSTKKEESLIIIPKFSINSTINLEKALETTLSTSSITSNSNYLNYNNKPVRLTYYYQKVGLTIGENGTKDSDYLIPKIEAFIDLNNKIIFNKPFYFIIMDKENQNVLLIGKIINPLY